MIILGVTHPINWNGSACIVNNGKLVVMIEEERLTRIKHAPNTPPMRAIDYCLSNQNLSYEDIDIVAIGFDFSGDLRASLNTDVEDIQQKTWIRKLSSFTNTGTTNKSEWVDKIQYLEEKLGLERFINAEIFFVNHHFAHAASAFYPSGFDNAMILSLDGSGGREAGLLGFGEGSNIEIHKVISDESSWGRMYELVTEILGFKRHSGEGKTMGLASYGNPNLKMFPFIDWSQEIPYINEDMLRSFAEGFVKRESTESALLEKHTRLAATAQKALEEASIRMVNWLIEKTETSNLCIAGGVGLNCVMNGKIATLDKVNAVFVQPVAHDAGTSLGAALAVHMFLGGERNWKMEHVYYGHEYTDDDIRKTLEKFSQLEYSFSREIEEVTAQELAKGSLVGWFQGRSEVGPRALGNRSILANPAIPEIKDQINGKVKFREMWRPFAPSILEENIDDYVTKFSDVPFMTVSYQVTEKAHQDISAAIHIDGTCRPQAVSKRTNNKYWNLIKSFEKITGIPAVLNTSFNIQGQPIVNSPTDAIETFINCGLDVLSIGNYIVKK